MDRKKIIRTTSIEVYRKLVEAKLLPPMRRRVYDNLYKYGPMTRNEIAENINMVPNDCSTRLKELRDANRVKEVGEDKCNVTGQDITLYDVTDMIGQDTPVRRGKKRVDVTIRMCPECPMVEIAEDDKATCWADKKATPQADRRGDLCPMDTKKFLLIGG